MVTQDPVRRTAAAWLARREAGDWTAQDAAECAAWCAADPSHARAFARVEALWAALPETVLTVVPRRRRWPAVALAASLALALLAGPEAVLRLRADALTGVGERRTVTLPDGSVAMLNTDSAIAVHGRTVRLLRGEAAFTVAPDPAHPFTVLSGHGSTTALGTRFIVRQDGEGARVTVIEHAVRIAEPGHVQVLRQGQTLRYGGGTIEPSQPVEIDAADAWMRGRLRVVNMPLGAVVAELNRYRRGYIGISDPDLARRPVSGVFRVDDPVGAVDVIQRTLGLATTRLTDRIIFLHR
jgi:transmembrane sensor